MGGRYICLTKKQQIHWKKCILLNENYDQKLKKKIFKFLFHEWHGYSEDILWIRSIYEYFFWYNDLQTSKELLMWMSCDKSWKMCSKKCSPQYWCGKRVVYHIFTILHTHGIVLWLWNYHLYATLQWFFDKGDGTWVEINETLRTFGTNWEP